MNAENPEILIEKLVAGGDGLGFLDGKAVFVPGVLPGERVRVRLGQRRRDFDRAALVDVINASPGRQSPPCSLAGVCGGCDWLHIRSEEQAARKVDIMREAFQRVGQFAWKEIGVETGPDLAYRNRVQIHRDHAGRLGFMSAGSERVVPVATCPVSVGSINRLFADPGRAPADRDRFTAWGDDETLAVEGLDDERDLEVRVLGKSVIFSVACFFQSNLSMLSKLLPFALEGLSGKAAADLYCGVGLFGAFLADRFERVTAVESSSLSMSYARRNIPDDRGDFYPVNMEQWVETDAARRPLDAVVVDPPRAGLGPEVCRWLRGAAPSRLVYVSCDPVTLARDLGELVRDRFTMDEVRIFDFYPQTSHVETVARLHSREDPT
ncbi:MAG: TRAM domain-containing protein [Spirochaetia bacterium]